MTVLRCSEPPRRLGRYHLGEKIADGGMAAVYVARCIDGPRSGEVVALKTMRREFEGSQEFTTMFTDEARIVSRLRHPNVVRYYELGRDRGHLFLAMELLRGQSLWCVWDACRAHRRRFPYSLIAWIGARVAEGLHHAHELADDSGRRLDVVHRDVNATNILLTYEGEVKIIDFGLAKAAGRASKTAAGIIKGKVAYMSPEQAVGGMVDRRTDIFALGTTLWELSCDRRLFRHADEDETLRRVYAADIPDPTRLIGGYPVALWRILQRALARVKDQRYRTAADLAKELDAFVAQASVSHAEQSHPRDGFAPYANVRDAEQAGARELSALLSELFPDEVRLSSQGTPSARMSVPSTPASRSEAQDMACFDAKRHRGAWSSRVAHRRWTTVALMAFLFVTVLGAVVVLR